MYFQSDLTKTQTIKLKFEVWCHTGIRHQVYLRFYMNLFFEFYILRVMYYRYINKLLMFYSLKKVLIQNIDVLKFSLRFYTDYFQ